MGKKLQISAYLLLNPHMQDQRELESCGPEVLGTGLDEERRMRGQVVGMIRSPFPTGLSSVICPSTTAAEWQPCHQREHHDRHGRSGAHCLSTPRLHQLSWSPDVWSLRSGAFQPQDLVNHCCLVKV